MKSARMQKGGIKCSSASQAAGALGYCLEIIRAPVDETQSVAGGEGGADHEF